MTSLSPPTPSDARIAQWRDFAQSELDRETYTVTVKGCRERIVAACDALLGEREAHSATKAAARRVEKAIVRYATVTSLEEHDPIRALELNREVQEALRALAALASKESNSE